jgi:hypothetical protein
MSAKHKAERRQTAKPEYITLRLAFAWPVLFWVIVLFGSSLAIILDFGFYFRVSRFNFRDLFSSTGLIRLLSLGYSAILKAMTTTRIRLYECPVETGATPFRRTGYRLNIIYLSFSPL